jgi:hypothetical protein
MAEELKMEKLTENNYHHWRLIAQGVLVSKGCWSAIEPGFEGEDMTNAQTLLDQKARTTLYLIVGKASLDDIGTLPTAREAWLALQRIHTEYDTFHGLTMVKEFVNASKEESESISEYISRRAGLHRKSKDSGFTFSEKNQCGFILLGLPEKYEPVCRSFNAPADEIGDLTFGKVKSKLIEEERRLARKDGPDGSKEGSGGALRVNLPRYNNSDNGYRRHPEEYPPAGKDETKTDTGNTGERNPNGTPTTQTAETKTNTTLPHHTDTGITEEGRPTDKTTTIGNKGNHPRDASPATNRDTVAGIAQETPQTAAGSKDQRVEMTQTHAMGRNPRMTN